MWSVLERPVKLLENANMKLAPSVVDGQIIMFICIIKDFSVHFIKVWR